MKRTNLTPKNTFRNLQADKQRRITAAAVREFAEYGFKQASVNRIVKESGIAKGSLYQYFAGKEALYLYVFTDFIALVKKTVKENETTSADQKVFSRIRFVINAGLQFIKNHPEYFRLYARLLSKEESPFREELLSQVRFFPVEYFAPLIRKGQDEGSVRTDVACELIVFMIDAVLDRFLLSASGVQNGIRFSPDLFPDPEMLVEQIIGLLAGGIAGTAN